ncbi:MAG TPA: 6-carboxytetrahydropterin synthase [Taishania sp.]|nr:6-carboxytetrahydropterin synthase [Taishania sp.]
MKICRRETFNAAHRLHVEGWDDTKNYQVFGKCSNPNYHGHNYILETWVEGEIDPLTGYVYDLGKLKELIRGEICHRFDHRNLNLDCPEFKGINPTAENIAVVIWNILRENLPQSLKLTVRLSETENNWVEYSGK